MCQCLPGQCIFADMDVVLAQALQPLGAGCRLEFPPQILSTSFRKTVRVPNVQSRVDLLANNLRKSLALIAPTCEALLKSRKHGWIQLSGHAGAFFPAGPETIWKKRLTKDNNETNAYMGLMNDSVSPMVPQYYGEVEYNGDYFIEMEDLLQHFHEPSVMDIKMGTRTFLESEVSNPVLRKDLYEKMLKQSPGEVTDAEREQQAITKLRYMTFREQESSTSTLGFRVEGIKLSCKQQPIAASTLKKTKTRDQVRDVIEQFLPSAQNRGERTRKEFLERLRMLRKRFEESEYFKSHEIIGSSLLLIYDSSHSGVWMIDFAKTVPAPSECQPLTHRDKWTLGSHEDGYLTGLDHLIQVLEDIHCH